MEYRRDGMTIVARLDKGDDVMAQLTYIAEQEDIQAGFVRGIGAVDHATISYFNIATREYQNQTFEEPFEVLSLEGTLTRKDSSPHQHLHIVLGRPDYSVIGGHLMEARVSVTFEAQITILNTQVGRKRSDEFDIDLIDFA